MCDPIVNLKWTETSASAQYRQDSPRKWSVKAFMATIYGWVCFMSLNGHVAEVEVWGA